jgi:adenylate cyclase
VINFCIPNNVFTLVKVRQARNKMKGSIHTIFVLMLLVTAGSSQLHAKLKGQAKIDSLKKQLPYAKEDTNKVSLLGDIAYLYYRLEQPDTMLKFATEQLALARQLNWQKGIARSIDFKGMAYEAKNEPRKALMYYDSTLQIYEQINKAKAADGAFYSGVLCYNINEYAQAIQYFFKALKICESVGICDVQASAYTGIAVVYGSGKDFATAVKYHTMALNIAEKCAVIDSIQLLGIYSNLAVSYQYKGDCANSLPYCLTALKLAGQLGETSTAANMYGNICLAYTQFGEYDNAIAYGQKALALSDSIRDKKHVAWSLYELGHAYLSSVTDTAKGREAHVISMGGMKAADKSARINTATEYLKRSLDSLHGTLKETELSVKVYEDLSKAYRLMGNWKQALETHDLFLATKDSIFTKEAGMQLLSQQLNYDFNKKEAAAQALQEKKDIQQKNIRNSTLAGMAGLLVFSLVVIRQRNKVKKEKAKVETEKSKSDALLLNILPFEVAEELKAKGATTARHYDNVTVLFTDFANFTEAGASMSPQNLIDELHTCFKKFDEITSLYNIEKIKTIGDAYLAVAGLPSPNPHHAEHVVQAAIEINRFMQDRLAIMGSKRTFAVRIGIHSGSVVAGIVGVKKFAYDIWGDTVNTAARMEQNSDAGKINISQTTYDLVKDKFNCDYRGEVEVKGKGIMKMYYVS